MKLDINLRDNADVTPSRVIEKLSENSEKSPCQALIYVLTKYVHQIRNLMMRMYNLPTMRYAWLAAIKYTSWPPRSLTRSDSDSSAVSKDDRFRGGGDAFKRRHVAAEAAIIR